MTTSGGVVDCDTHYWESPEDWCSYLDPAYRDRVPEFVDDGGRILMRVGESLYPSAPEHPGLGATYGPAAKVHPQVLWDKEVSTDAGRRLEFMDGQHTDVNVIFPTLGMVGFANVEDADLGAAYARAYNRWCADFASADARRLRPAMLVPFNHPQRAVEEMRFAREQCGMTVAFANPTPPLGTCWSDAVFEPVWSALEDLGITLAFHESAVGAGPSTVGLTRYRGRSRMLYLCAHTVEPQLAIMDLLLGGTLVAHPGLRVGLMEAHLSWIPGWLELIDHLGDRYREARVDAELTASDVFRRQCFVAAFPDDIAVREFVDAVGLDNLVFSSDWPHKSLTEQHTALSDFLGRDDLSQEEKERVASVNPARWIEL